MALIGYFISLIDLGRYNLIEFTKELPVTSELNVMRILNELKEDFSLLMNVDFLNITLEEFEELIHMQTKIKPCNKFKPLVYVATPKCLLCYLKPMK